MTDDPFAAFAEGQPPSEAPTQPKKRGPKPGAKRAIPPKKTEPVEPPATAKKERKARKPIQLGQRRPVMIPIGLLPELGGLSDEDASRLMSFIGNMHTLPKKSRRRIAEILSKIFAS